MSGKLFRGRWSWVFLFGLVSCALFSTNLKIEKAQDLRERNIKRIAVLPISGHVGRENRRAGESGTILTDLVNRVMGNLPHWEIISEREVNEVQSLAELQEEGIQRAQMVGELVYADAVLFGRVIRFQERIGQELGAKQPASVTFELNLFDVKRGNVIWRARFQETQRALSENILAVKAFTQRGARWITAEELALEGVKKALANLNRSLYAAEQDAPRGTMDPASTG